MGKPDVGIGLLEPALEHIRDLDAALWFPHIAASLGYAYALSGRTAEGIPLLERAAESAVAMKWNGGRVQMLSCLAETYLLASRGWEAEETAALALELIDLFSIDTLIDMLAKLGLRAKVVLQPSRRRAGVA
jgi:hypothetical protein